MKYRHHDLAYEIEDEWLRIAGAQDFRARRECYRYSGASQGRTFQVAISAVRPLIERAQEIGIFCDSQKTGESACQRVVRILRWIVTDAEIEPVVVERVSGGDYEYRLLAGCHRFYCANAMGFKCVPAMLENE